MNKKAWMALAAALVLLLAFPAARGSAPVAEQLAAPAYVDGTYDVVVRGYKKGLHVSTTILDGRIADVQVTEHNEDEPYFSDAMAVIPQILETQSTEVDAVTGATKTCDAIAKAVDEALLLALQPQMAE